MKITLLNALLILIFLASGCAKLAGLEFELVAFERWGYPLWFMYLTGALEVLVAIGMLKRQWMLYSVFGMVIIMIGAVGTHALNAEWPMLVLASSILSLAVYRLWLGSSRIRTMFGF